jgi:hypothetical protein
VPRSSAISPGQAHDYTGGYGVGVAASIRSAYLASTVARIARGLNPFLSIRITSRVTPMQMAHVGAIESNTTEPSRLTSLT